MNRILCAVGFIAFAAGILAIPTSKQGNGNTMSFSIRDHEGNDVSHLFNISHQHHRSAEPSGLSKRGSTPITCNPVIQGVQYTFLSSQCDRATSPQAWTCTAFDEALADISYDTHEVNTTGSCSSSQICVNGVPNNIASYPGTTAAYCADVEGYAKIAETLLSKMTYTDTKTYSGPSGSMHAAEAILTTDDIGIPLTVASLSVRPQTQINGFPYGTWEIGDADGCADCYSNQLTPIPIGTESIYVSAQINPGTAAGECYINTF